MKHHTNTSPRTTSKKKLFDWLFEAPPKAEQYIDRNEIDIGNINLPYRSPRRSKMLNSEKPPLT